MTDKDTNTWAEHPEARLDLSELDEAAWDCIQPTEMPVIPWNPYEKRITLARSKY